MKKLTDSIIILQENRQATELQKVKIKKNQKKINAKKNIIKKSSRISQAKLEHLKSYLKISNNLVNIHKRQNEYIVNIPKDFSLFKKPEKVLEIINNISQLQKYKQIKIINIDHSMCENHDLAAEILLANSVASIRSFKTRQGAKFRIKGTFPTNNRMCRLMRSIGIVSEIGDIRYHVKSKDKLRLFKRESQLGEITNIFGKDKKTRATEDFTTHLNECLHFINGKLDSQEEKKLDKYLGEVLGNAEDHSGKKLWHIVGYLDASKSDDICSEIVIFNVGKTIFETFEEKKGISIVYDKMKQYIDKHKANFTREQLTMVYALQQNVSSKKNESIDRGQGTKYLIDLFNHLSDECKKINKLRKAKHSNGKPTMLILSGGVMLKFDGKYLPEIKDDQKMIYAFNESNDLDIEPDISYTPALKNVTFPGTVIYIKFPLHQKTIGDENE